MTEHPDADLASFDRIASGIYFSSVAKQLLSFTLPEPDLSDFVSDYVAPTNEVEKALCDAMAKVLKLQQVEI